MAKKKPRKLGFDPLAWMKQEEFESAKPSMSTEASEDTVDDKNPGLNKKVASAKPKPAARKKKQVASDKQTPPKQVSESKTEPVPDAVKSEPVNDTRVSLPESLGMEQMLELHQKLKQAIECQQAVVLDGKAVESTHAVGLQLLTAFFGEIAGCGAEVQWQDPSDELIASAKLLGLSETLQLPAA
ncbi:MAG: hypothetical protein BMS9Abin36_0546 [Gammaproteobacteria bacterium]|nr:MAG: hypothetical protein BMS9Abin36_0546 [Gammaproteobacteria bacterium]